ncbi:MAG: competence protein ComK [Acholeplasmataceae bacterium]|nr:competence protein ComK [Acholeplasmataceae bacterium]
MIEYIKHEHQMTYIYQDSHISKHKHSMNAIIHSLCIEHLITYDGYVKAIQKKYHKSQRIPLVLSNDLMLIPIMRIRDYENIWINHSAIKAFYTSPKGIIITFFSNHTLEIDKNMAFLEKAINFVNIIKKEKVKHFHT